MARVDGVPLEKMTARVDEREGRPETKAVASGNGLR